MIRDVETELDHLGRRIDLEEQRRERDFKHLLWIGTAAYLIGAFGAAFGVAALVLIFMGLPK